MGRLLDSFIPTSAGRVKTSDVEALLGGIELPLGVKAKGKDRQDFLREWLQTPTPELREAFPLYDLLMRLQTPEGEEPAPAKKLREDCIRTKKGNLNITITDGERNTLIGSLNSTRER